MSSEPKAADPSWLRELASVSDPEASPSIDYAAVLRRAAAEIERLRTEVEAWRIIGEVLKVHSPTGVLGTLDEIVRGYALAAASGGPGGTQSA